MIQTSGQGGRNRTDPKVRRRVQEKSCGAAQQESISLNTHSSVHSWLSLKKQPWLHSMPSLRGTAMSLVFLKSNGLFAVLALNPSMFSGCFGCMGDTDRKVRSSIPMHRCKPVVRPIGVRSRFSSRLFAVFVRNPSPKRHVLHTPFRSHLGGFLQKR